MTTSSQNPDVLSDQLIRLETALDTPAVPGELTGWAANLRNVYDEAARSVLARIEKNHVNELREIENEDLGLVPRVEEMRQEDARLATLCRSLATACSDFEKKAAAVGSDEKQAMPAYQKLIADGLQWVMSVRKQETTLRTWLQEAFERDRGVKD
jgi:hypothetical protein